MNAPWVVLKFGGASVATAAGWDAIARLLRRRREQGVNGPSSCTRPSPALPTSWKP